LNLPNNSKLTIILSIIILNTILFDEAFAYIDPSGINLVFQMLMGVLIGVGITIKIYWERIKMKFSSSSKSND